MASAFLSTKCISTKKKRGTEGDKTLFRSPGFSLSVYSVTIDPNTSSQSRDQLLLKQRFDQLDNFPEQSYLSESNRVYAINYIYPNVGDNVVSLRGQ